jgi:hypothetical protein
MNLAYRWFCKLKITDKVPHHSTFSKNRHGRFRDSEVFRFVFEQVLKRCMEEGLIGGEGFAVDASVVKADASKQKHHEDDDDWGGGSRAINEYLDAIEGRRSSEDPGRKISQTDPMARGPAHLVVRPTTPTRPTTWWTPTRHHRGCRGNAGPSAHRRSGRRRP